MSAKAKTDERKFVLLSFGKENNFVNWRNFPIDACTSEFGFQENIFENGIVSIFLEPLWLQIIENVIDWCPKY